MEELYINETGQLALMSHAWNAEGYTTQKEYTRVWLSNVGTMPATPGKEVYRLHRLQRNSVGYIIASKVDLGEMPLSICIVVNDMSVSAFVLFIIHKGLNIEEVNEDR